MHYSSYNIHCQLVNVNKISELIRLNNVKMTSIPFEMIKNHAYCEYNAEYLLRKWIIKSKNCMDVSDKILVVNSDEIIYNI